MSIMYERPVSTLGHPNRAARHGHRPERADADVQRALSATLGDEGITLNAVLPSLTRTAMTEGIPQAIVDASLGRQVIHREAEPGDIAGSVFLLAADEAGWITGQTIMANGGNAFGL